MIELTNKKSCIRSWRERVVAGSWEPLSGANNPSLGNIMSTPQHWSPFFDTVLYYTYIILYYTLLFYTQSILCTKTIMSTPQHWSPFFDTDTVLYCIVLYFTILYYTILYSYYSVLYCTILYTKYSLHQNHYVNSLTLVTFLVIYI